MSTSIKAFNESQDEPEREICELLGKLIDKELPEAESKIWHRHPVWFLEGNPTVGYSKLKAGIRLMFWSGMDFGEEKLQPGTGKFKDASILYTSAEQVDEEDLKRWLEKSTQFQWDYKNLIKRKGTLVKLK
ncbi:MAG TPA: DUF1801 domain-containing protein [Lunatimonas sp.]|nr:DUF1801 domain-containing protein [Lunatimonas sp.]